MTRPVPVLFLIHSLGHGGSERQLAGLAQGIDRNEFSPHVASVVGGFRADELRAAGIPVIQLDLRGLFAPNVAKVAGGLRRYIRENGIRLLHAFDYGPSLFAIATARSCGIAALSSQRYYMDSVPPKYRFTALASHWLADGVVVNSAALKTYLHEQLRYPLRKIEACPNGLDTSVFRDSPRERIDAVAGAGLVIGTVCVLRREKNLGQLIEAFAKIRAGHAGVRLLIAGSGPEEQNLKALAARLGLDAQACVFLPTTADVPRVLRSIDIFVHPSLSEGMPNAVMEAMACGCAVVASRVGGGPELIEQGVHGLLVEPGNGERLEDSMETLARSPDARRAMGQAAAARMRREFSLEASCRTLETIYRKALAKRQHGG